MTTATTIAMLVVIIIRVVDDDNPMYVIGHDNKRVYPNNGKMNWDFPKEMVCNDTYVRKFHFVLYYLSKETFSVFCAYGDKIGTAPAVVPMS